MIASKACMTPLSVTSDRSNVVKAWMNECTKGVENVKILTGDFSFHQRTKKIIFWSVEILDEHFRKQLKVNKVYKVMRCNL